MRHDPDQKKATRQRILQAVHKGFRRQGFDGAGVDGLARDAGVTSGAFYKHFKSKADAFRESVALSVDEFREAVEQFRDQYGESWLKEFAGFYLGEKRCAELGESCGLQSLTPEVARADTPTRSLFQSKLLSAAESLAEGLPAPEGQANEDRVWATLALLIGGVSLARAVEDPRLADEIAKAVRRALIHDDDLSEPEA